MTHLNTGAATHVGLVRRSNQDAHLAAPPVFVVADGMGGHDGGEVASAIVVEEFATLAREGFAPEQAVARVEEALGRSQSRIREHVEARRHEGAPQYYSGTTVVAAVLVPDEAGAKWLLANLGDSRAYKLHDGVLEQVSVDHSVVQQMIDAGTLTREAAETHPERHVITRAVGPQGSLDVDLFLLPLSAAERVLLCSDGVSGMVDDELIAEVLRSYADPRDAADRLVAAALEAGGEDNATAVVIDVVGLAESGPREQTRLEPISLEEKLGALP